MNHHFLVDRFQIRPKSTVGRLLIDGVYFCFTLEDTIRLFPNKVPKETAIWEGVYDLTIDHSDKFGRDMPHILNVPMFTGIRIHPGSTSADTEGCLLVGYDGSDIFNEDIHDCKRAFDDLFLKLSQFLGAKDTVKISLINPIQQMRPSETVTSQAHAYKKV
jgi:hypothetical protein